MASEPTLYARMELRLNDFERKLQRATKSTDTTMKKIEARGDQLTARLQGMGTGAFGGLIRGAGLALAPILSVGAALNTAKAALDDFDAIAKSAKASGLDPEAFQEFAFAADLGGVSMDEFSKSLETFNKNAGLAAVGKGKMLAALKALNPELLTNIQATTSQSERLKLAADAIDKTGSASAKAALATTLFGDSGTRMVEALKGGSAALAETATQARKLGIIVDRDLIARAETMSDEFSTASKVMNLQFQQALIDLAPLLIGTAKLTGELAAGINYLSESMQALGQRGTARLEQDLAGINDTLAKANATMAPGVVGTMGVEIDPSTQAKMVAERDAIFAELKKRAIDQLRVDLSRPKPTEDPTAPSGGGGDAAAKSALAHGDAVKKLIADLQFERDTLGETALEQNILNTLRNAGVDAASAEGLAIRGLVTDLESQKSAIQANADAMKEFEGLATNALTGFISDLRDGKSAGEALGNVMNSILDNVIQIGVQSLVGGLFGGGGGGIGKLFGFANGGIAAHGKPMQTFARGGVSRTAAIFGEAGPEAAVPLPDGRSIPVKFMGAPGPMSSQRQGGGALTVHVSLDSELLRAEVRDTAGAVVATAAPQIVRAANSNAPSVVAEKSLRFGN
ncbi:hypothetical protein [Devosia aquimaris]|uniref:hypothetical protein n=1 Tax=Devosia aquimaris TaxID=2866214 RepID=UPI001CD0F94B|nr:hypothetical protein [Devosia sp. CJK-A8-3]